MKKLKDGDKKLDLTSDNEMTDLLRFLQLFAEGHYGDLQNYMRHQTNSYHSFDILESFTVLLNAYMQLSYEAFFETIVQCFDTIIEYIQGPCFANQKALMQGAFLDISANLLDYDERMVEIMGKPKTSNNQNIIENEEGNEEDEPEPLHIW